MRSSDDESTSERNTSGNSVQSINGSNDMCVTLDRAYIDWGKQETGLSCFAITSDNNTSETLDVTPFGLN